jgi:hypothetical protein
MGLKEIFSSLKSTSSNSMSTQTQNNNSSKRNITNSISKKNHYDLHNFSLDNDLLESNCILLNKTYLSQQQQSPPFIQIIPASTMTRRESTRSNTSSALNNSNSEPTRFLIESHAKHVNSILNTNSQPRHTLNYNNNKIFSKMVTSPSCDVSLLATSPLKKEEITTPDSTKPRNKIRTNPWIRSPSFHTNPNQIIKTFRSQTNDDILSLSEPKRYNKMNLSFNTFKIDESMCKKCFSLKCSCLKNSKDSGISSIINGVGNQLSPYSLKVSPQTTFDSTKTATSSSSSSISSLNNNSNKNSIETKLLPQNQNYEQQRINDDYSILFEEALEPSSKDYLIDQNDDKVVFKRNASYRYSLNQNLVTYKPLVDDTTANFVAEVTNLFDQALLELPNFSMPDKQYKQEENPVNNNNDEDDDDIELENSVNELYKQIEILKEQKMMLDEKMKISKFESVDNRTIPVLENNNICKIVKEIRL